MGDNYAEFCKSAEQAKKNGKGLTFFFFRENLKYDSEGIYSYGSKIARIDLKQKTIQKLGHYSIMHYNNYSYAVHVFKTCYDFREVLSPCDLIHIEHLSYDDHT